MTLGLALGLLTELYCPADRLLEARVALGLDLTPNPPCCGGLPYSIFWLQRSLIYPRLVVS